MCLALQHYSQPCRGWCSGRGSSGMQSFPLSLRTLLSKSLAQNSLTYLKEKVLWIYKGKGAGSQTSCFFSKHSGTAPKLVEVYHFLLIRFIPSSGKTRKCWGFYCVRFSGDCWQIQVWPILHKCRVFSLCPQISVRLLHLKGCCRKQKFLSTRTTVANGENRFFISIRLF